MFKKKWNVSVICSAEPVVLWFLSKALGELKEEKH